MKKLTMFLACIFSLQISNAQWLPAGTFEGPVNAILTVPAQDNSGGEIIFVGLGNNGGVEISHDGGETWNKTSMDGKTIYSLAANGSYIVCGTDEDGVYFSPNNGSTWYQSGLPNRTILSLQKNGTHLYAGTENFGVYCSDNNGANWVHIGLNGKSIPSLGSFGSYLYAGTLNEGLFCTTNIGNTWNQSLITNLHLVSIVINQNNGNIFAATSNEIFRSTNYGNTWYPVLLTLHIFAMFFSQEGYLFAGTNHGVQVSDGGLNNWLLRNEGLPESSEPSAFGTYNNNLITGIKLNFDNQVTNSLYKRSFSELIGIIPISNEVPKSFTLSQNYPNPFNPSTSIRFSIKSSSEVKLSVFNSAGQQVAELVNENLNAGTYEYKFDAAKLPSGVYFYRLSTDQFTETKKMILVK